MATILLIENDHETAHLVTGLLESRGHTISRAVSALEGLKMARAIKPEIILVEMSLPDIEGKVVVHQLRSYPGFQQIPIVAFADEANARAKRVALAFGCNEFISKPFNVHTFRDQIEMLMQYFKHESREA